MKKVLFLLFLSAGGLLSGQDRLFTYTYQSTVLSAGQNEIEVWNTYRTGKATFFNRLDQRLEFETGLGKGLQSSFYVNFSSKAEATGLSAAGEIETKNSLAFSNEWKLKLMDPVANLFGLALYGEYGIAADEFELEAKIIADKRIKKLTMAMNLSGEMEIEPEWEKETVLDLNLALAWSLSPRFSLTLENMYRTVYVNGIAGHKAIFAGPGFSMVNERFWVNFTILPQVLAFSNTTSGKLDLDEFERVQFRLLFSYALQGE